MGFCASTREKAVVQSVVEPEGCAGSPIDAGEKSAVFSLSGLDKLRPPLVYAEGVMTAGISCDSHGGDASIAYESTNFSCIFAFCMSISVLNDE